MLKNKVIVKSIILWLCTLSVTCTGIVSPALPLIRETYAHIENSQMLVKLILVMPNLFIAIFAPIVGVLAPRIGKIKMLLFAFILYAASGTTGAYIDNIYYIIFFRGCLGISISIIMTVVTTLIADYFDSNERSTMVGLQTTFMSIGSTFYALLSGTIADINWHWIFYIYAVSLIAFPLVLIFLPDPDVIKKENQDPHKLKLDRKIIQNNFAVYLVCVINFITMSMFYMVPLQLPFLLYNDPAFSSIGMNAKYIAFATSTEVIFAAIFSLKYRRFKRNRDYAVLCALAFAFIALGYSILCFAKNYPTVLSSMVLVGVGMGLMMPNSTLWVISITKPIKRPLFIGIFTTSTFFGKFASPFIAMFVMKFVNLRNAFFVDAFFMLFVAIFSMFLNDYFKRINRIRYRKELLLARRMNLIDENYNI